MSAFEQDLLASVRQAKRGEGHVTHVPMTAAAEARLKVDVSQSAFAQLLGGNRPLEPREREVEFFPMEEVLHEEVKIH